jgi:uncharacterized protein involved in tolerance to divalent cations
VTDETEHLLLIKTLPERFTELRGFIVLNHSYDTPEVTGIEVDMVSERYKNWVTSYLT